MCVLKFQTVIYTLISTFCPPGSKAQKDIQIQNVLQWLPKEYINNARKEIKVITKLPNSEQSYKGKVKTHNYINRQNQSTTGKL